MFPISGCISCQHQYCMKKVPLFESFEHSEMEDVLKLIERFFIPKGQYVFKEGNLSNRLYIVNGGAMKVYRTTKDGKEQILYVLTDGDIFGEISLFHEESNEFDAIALEDTHLCTLPKNDFNKLLESHQGLYGKVLDHAYSRIKTLEDLIQTVTSKDIDTRVAALLLQLADQFGVRHKHCIDIPLKLNREEMANLIGLTRETVSRKLSQFQAEGLVAYTDNRSIQLTDVEALTLIAEK